MVSWFLIIGGILFIILGLWGIFLNKVYSQQLPATGAADNLNDLERGLQESKKRLQDLLQEINNIIDEISRKEINLKRTIDNLEEKLLTEMERRIIKGDQPSQKDFKEVLDQELVQKRDIPERYYQIMEYYKEGYSMEEIAQKLDLGVRETRLFFKLYGGEENAAR